ncbi:MAG TPA: hypothetical protein VNX68_14315 [Nitrosopumilaceae archaeon]|nr:hypothetical protein [Nitrosopumilaceae archaeon]
MNHYQVFDNFFNNYDFDLRAIEKKIDTLLEIALSTNNGLFDDAEERADLFFFKMGLMEVLESAHILGEKQHKKHLQKYELVNQTEAAK